MGFQIACNLTVCPSGSNTDILEIPLIGISGIRGEEACFESYIRQPTWFDLHDRFSAP